MDGDRDAEGGARADVGDGREEGREAWAEGDVLKRRADLSSTASYTPHPHARARTGAQGLTISAPHRHLDAHAYDPDT